MKKIIIFLLTSMFFIGQASAIGLNVGIAGTAGVFHGTGEENENGEISSEDAAGAVTYASIFVEVPLNEKISFGVDYVPTSLESDTAESVVTDKTTSDSSSNATQKVQIDFNDLTTAYVMLNLTEGLFVKAGVVTVDVATNESLGTGSSYADTDLSGSVLGVGYTGEVGGNGAFVRVEANYLDLGGATVTASNTDNKVTLSDVQGLTAKVAIGKSF